jgi:hypothetical protein
MKNVKSLPALDVAADSVEADLQEAVAAAPA